MLNQDSLPDRLNGLSSSLTVASLAGPRSVDDVLREWDAMDVPHFQRGLVWERGNIELLLESLYLNTPCGSLVLWEAPPELLPSDPTRSVRYLIVDGQQRLRTLHRVFFGEQEYVEDSVALEAEDDGAEAAEDTEDGESREGIWCLNLGRVAEIGDEEFSGGKRFALFRYTGDPRRQLKGNISGAPIHDREALLPLTWFLGHEDNEIRRLVMEGPDAPVRKAALAVLDNHVVRDRLRQMRAKPVFQVTVLGPERSLTDVIGIYNRINSAGKRVEAEEKAFANLVGACEGEKDVNRALGDFFIKVHGSRAQERDDLLSRQRENRFGFKLFMRVFTIALAYHTDRSLGSSAFSFDSVNPRTLEKARAHIPQMLGATVRALEDVARIVREKLLCDDLRMLPDTASLWPLFQLMIRFPDLRHCEATLAGLAYRLVLAKLKKSELLALCDDVKDAENSIAALHALDQHDALQADALTRTIERRVERSRSLNARYALALYWLLRKRRASDFSYHANADRIKDLAALRARYSREPELSENVDPERQHIVPYKRLKELYKLSTGPRLGSHFVNDIGNLTYISALLNSFVVGIGSRALALEREPGEGVLAHLLGEEGSTLIDPYTKACTSDGRREGRDAFEQFCGLRRRLIAGAFTDWDMQLRTAAARETPLAALPVPRLVSPTDIDRIQELGYPHEVLTRLIRLRNRDDARTTQVEAADLSFAIVGTGGRQRIRFNLNQSEGELKVKVRDARLRRWLVEDWPAETRTVKRAIVLTLDADEPSTPQFLDAVIAELSRSPEPSGSAGESSPGE